MSGVLVIRRRLKAVIPAPLRALLRGGLKYLQRVGRWSIILWQVRGVTLQDKVTLVISAIAAPILSLRTLYAWQDPILLRDACVNVPGVGRFEIRAFTDDLWHILPWRESHIFRTLRAILKPGETFVDAGANIGVYSVLASRIVGPEGRVVSFEMIPETTQILRRHIALNNCLNIEVIEGALAEEPGKSLEAWIPEGKYGQASIERTAGTIRLAVKTLTLAEELHDIETVHVMKMDIEGAELGALKGMGIHLAKVRAIIFENRDGGEVVSYLEEQGFRVTEVDGNNALAERSRNQA